MTPVILGWGKPHGYDRGVITAFHAITDTNDRGAFVTACAGRWWSSADPYTYFPSPFLCAGETYRVTEDTRFPFDGDGYSYLVEPCPACLRALADRPRARSEMDRALAQGTELVRTAEAY